jgi:hypothetical protein
MLDCVVAFFYNQLSHMEPKMISHNHFPELVGKICIDLYIKHDVQCVLVEDALKKVSLN